MKNLVLALSFIALSSGIAKAQSDSLVVDDNNKLIYYQVVQQASSPVDTLYKRALLFFKKAYTSDRLKLVKEDKANATLSGKGAILVSKKSLVTKHEDASIIYNMVIEAKADKYRFWLTDFIIVPLERDRYANYVPVLGKKVALEDGGKKLSKRDYDGYLDKVLADSREIGSILRSYMNNQVVKPKVEVKKKSITTKEW